MGAPPTSTLPLEGGGEACLPVGRGGGDDSLNWLSFVSFVSKKESVS
jgi:hypothetical protein